MNKPGTLYVVATPIGNLSDVTLRALEVLKSVDLVVSEDTRVTRKLLAHFDVHAETMSYHAHSGDRSVEVICERLAEGQTLALVTDAGTPAVSDPGGYLIRLVRERLPDAAIIAVPGPSALIAAVSVAGLLSNEFTFIGFFPRKKGRETLLKEIAASERPYAFYESPHRMAKTLGLIAAHEGLASRRIVLVKEISKVFERTMIGTAAQILASAEEDWLSRGEFVAIIDAEPMADIG
jgi:16S rRNA (cytidine1402-2'-O)-methyltransferase